jgi:hypothetical protein
VVRLREAERGRHSAQQRHMGVAVLRLLDDFLNLPDFLLDFTGDFFDDAVGFEVGIVGELSDVALDRTFYLVKCAFGFVFGAVFHHMVPPGDATDVLSSATGDLAATQFK